MLTPVHVWHDIVQALVRPLPARRLALADAEGCVLARGVQTLHPLPPFDASAMDGYAVRARDVLAAGPAHPVRLRVIASAPAGHPVGAVVGAGDAVRILTGAQLPAGSDAVVAVESTDGGRDVVQVREPVGPGRHVRRAGEDLTQGAHVLEPGGVVGPGQAAAAAAAGHTALLVVPRPRVVIVSTGDELVAPGQPLAPGTCRTATRSGSPPRSASPEVRPRSPGAGTTRGYSGGCWRRRQGPPTSSSPVAGSAPVRRTMSSRRRCRVALYGS